MTERRSTKPAIDRKAQAEGALAALRRARDRAEAIAWETGTVLIVAGPDGNPTRVQPRSPAERGDTPDVALSVVNSPSPLAE